MVSFGKIAALKGYEVYKWHSWEKMVWILKDMNASKIAIAYILPFLAVDYQVNQGAQTGCVVEGKNEKWDR